MKTLSLIIAICILTSCFENDRHSGQKGKFENVFLKDTHLELYEASIEIPQGWKQLNTDTFPQVADATSRYRFYNRKDKLVILDYGLSAIGNPAEPYVIPGRWRERYIRFKVDTANTIFDDNPELAEIRKRGPYNFSILNVSNFQATYYQPKPNEKGFIGISIDSIGEIADNPAGLTFYAKDLDSVETQEMINVIKSLKLRQFN
jgi:hypothetical protein